MFLYRKNCLIFWGLSFMKKYVYLSVIPLALCNTQSVFASSTAFSTKGLAKAKDLEITESNLSAQITECLTSISNVNNSLSNIGTIDFDALISQLSSTISELSTVKDSLEEMSENIATKSDFTDIAKSSEISALSSNVNELSLKIPENIATSEEMTLLSNNLTNLSEKIPEELATKSDFTNIAKSSEISVLSNNVNELSLKIPENIPTSEEMTLLSNNLTNLSDKIPEELATKSDLTDIAKSSEISALSSSVNELSLKIPENIATSEEMTLLSNNLTNLSEKIPEELATKSDFTSIAKSSEVSALLERLEMLKSEYDTVTVSKAELENLTPILNTNYVSLYDKLSTVSVGKTIYYTGLESIEVLVYNDEKSFTELLDLNREFSFSPVFYENSIIQREFVASLMNFKNVSWKAIHALKMEVLTENETNDKHYCIVAETGLYKYFLDFGINQEKTRDTEFSAIRKMFDKFMSSYIDILDYLPTTVYIMDKKLSDSIRMNNGWISGYNFFYLNSAAKSNTQDGIVNRSVTMFSPKDSVIKTQVIVPEINHVPVKEEVKITQNYDIDSLSEEFIEENVVETDKNQVNIEEKNHIGTPVGQFPIVFGSQKKPQQRKLQCGWGPNDNPSKVLRQSGFDSFCSLTDYSDEYPENNVVFSDDSGDEILIDPDY